MDFESQIEKIAKDIADRKDKEVALEFTKHIYTLLKNKGVSPVIEEYIRDIAKENSIEQKYGVAITGLDFTEHDKVFEDKIAKLEKQIERLMREKQFAYDRSERLMKTADIKNSANEELRQRIAELERKNNQLTESILRKETEIHELENKETYELPFNPLKTANMLINAKYKDEIPFLERQVDRNVYDIDDLEQIAEHLLVYCKHNKESEE